MAGDVTILAQGDQDAPLAYVLPGAQEIIVKSCYASYDGTGASGDFLPVVQFISPAGQVVATAQAPKVTAGASADVSFFPRVAPQVASSLETTNGSSVTVDPTTELLIGTGLTLTNPSSGVAKIVAGSVGAASLPSAGMNSTGIDLTSAGDYVTIQQIPFNTDETYPNYSANDGSSWDSAGPYYSRNPGLGINILQKGIYLVFGSGSGVPGAGAQLRTTCSYLGGADNSDPLLTTYSGGVEPGVAVPGDGTTWFTTTNLQAKGLYYVNDVTTSPVWVGIGTVLPVGLNWSNGSADHAVFVTRVGEIGNFPPNGFD